MRTDDPVATATARSVLELLVSELPARALELPPERSELVRVCRSAGGGRLAVQRRAPPERPRSLAPLREARPRPLHRLRALRADVRRGPGDVRPPARGQGLRHGRGPRRRRGLARLTLRRLRRLRRFVSERRAVGAWPSRPPTDRANGHDHLRLLWRRLHARRARARRRGGRDHSEPRRARQPRTRLRQGPLRARVRALARAPHNAARQARWRVARGELGGGDRPGGPASWHVSSATTARTRSRRSPRRARPTRRTT